MNARALQETELDPMDAAMLAEDPEGAARGSLAILLTMAAMAVAVVAAIVSVVMVMRRRRSTSNAVAMLPKKAVDTLQHAVTKLQEVAA